MERKYSDNDVRQDSSLKELAENYLKAYTGSFDFLLGAKRALLSNYELNTGTIRGVLNCMLYDANVVNMPVPAGQTFDAAEHLPDYYDRQIQHPPGRSQLREQRSSAPPSRIFPHRVECKTTWKNYKLGISLRPQANLIHKIDPRSKLVVYRLEGTEDRYLWNLNWYCNPLLHYQINQNQAGFAKRTRLLTFPQGVCLLWKGKLELDGMLIPERKWKACPKCEVQETAYLGQLKREQELDASSQSEQLTSTSTTSP